MECLKCTSFVRYLVRAGADEDATCRDCVGEVVQEAIDKGAISVSVVLMVEPQKGERPGDQPKYIGEIS